MCTLKTEVLLRQHLSSSCHFLGIYFNFSSQKTTTEQKHCSAHLFFFARQPPDVAVAANNNSKQELLQILNFCKLFLQDSLQRVSCLLTSPHSLWPPQFLAPSPSIAPPPAPTSLPTSPFCFTCLAVRKRKTGKNSLQKVLQIQTDLIGSGEKLLSIGRGGG